MPSVVTRFAPSPTGRLHLGHAFSAILAHDRARAAGGRFLLRIEDIDGTRSRAEHVAAIEADLRWLGLGWDGPVLFQSSRLDVYAAALERLRGMGLLYPCFCTRAEIAASLSAPHGPEAVYPGTCRGLHDDMRAARMVRGDRFAWRIDMAKAVALTPPLPGREGLGVGRPEADVALHYGPTHPSIPSLPGRGGAAALVWTDEIAGTVVADPLSHGDVILARKDAPASYHLAVTIDDSAQDVSHVVRGIDLFAATHVHRLLQVLLGLPTPTYHHHALIADADGTRLAKRTNAPTLERLRLAGEDGASVAERLRAGIGFIAVNA
ncbi:glutamyl-Q tRNA(Asp) synthetase [Sphingomonas glacialis]|uniref:Glutamyl-Q tRNA(Asp) synthetase n=1 Tax=Sphingomonas glacialis TaxID=658225 RepID=A0A502FFX6_9SPHN|nr:glutamyl-Q tRNA(Asp) synthetase [Sphingomonas glacialis]TPG48239.1 glutamyl-Q tRNA(Asp) synthetase [Sphingomonas glacialis]